ncbi:MAG: AbrB family transcriptional regulator [Pseudomonadota bacterium]
MSDRFVPASRRALRIAGTLALAAAAGWVCEALRVPLPWMIGPLLATALCGVSGLPVDAAGPLRNAGQWAIGTALGLYFTPEVLQQILRLAPALAAGIAWALLLGYGFYRLLATVSQARSAPERATAYFAAAIGGASEMAVLGERSGGRTDRIAAAHSLRVLIVVVSIPFAYQWAGLRGADVALPAAQAVQPLGLALLVGLTVAGALALRRLRLPNPWVLGALAVALALTGSGLALSALPKAVTNLGQLFIGVALGTRFTPEFVHTAPRWLGAVALGTLGMIGLSAGFAWSLAQLAGLHWATVLLGTSPGGIAEMCITAKVLQLGVPVVTAFHVTRYVAVLLLTAPLYRWIERRAAAAPVT